MTTQELFDRVANHLLTQNARAILDDICFYRSDDGLKCAVGCLIDDQHYCIGLEKKPFRNRLVFKAVEGSIGRKLEDEEIALLERLQWMHDCEDVEDWPDGLRRIATDFDLEYREDQYDHAKP